MRRGDWPWWRRGTHGLPPAGRWKERNSSVRYSRHGTLDHLPGSGSWWWRAATLDKNNVKERGCVPTHSSKLQSLKTEKSRQPGLEAAADTVPQSGSRGQRDGCCPPAAFLYLYSPGSHPGNGITHSWWGIPPQLVQSRLPPPPPPQAYLPGVPNFCPLTINTNCHIWSIILFKSKRYSVL